MRWSGDGGEGERWRLEAGGRGGTGWVAIECERAAEGGMDGWMDIAYSEYMHERWKLAWLNSDCI